MEEEEVEAMWTSAIRHNEYDITNDEIHEEENQLAEEKKFAKALEKFLLDEEDELYHGDFSNVDLNDDDLSNDDLSNDDLSDDDIDN